MRQQGEAVIDVADEWCVEARLVLRDFRTGGRARPR